MLEAHRDYMSGSLTANQNTMLITIRRLSHDKYNKCNRKPVNKGSPFIKCMRSWLFNNILSAVG